MVTYVHSSYSNAFDVVLHYSKMHVFTCCEKQNINRCTFLVCYLLQLLCSQRNKHQLTFVMYNNHIANWPRTIINWKIESVCVLMHEVITNEMS